MFECAVEKITPALAKEYLKKNTDNYRPLKRHLINSYAASMKAGRWEMNGEPIVFGENGILKDGQNRLAAVIKSGCTVQMAVTRGIKDNVKIFNMGEKRTPTDIVKAEGFDCDSTVTAAANIIVNRFSGERTGPAVIDYVKKHADELNRALRVTTSGTGAKSKNAPSVVATYLMLRTKQMPHYEAELFFRLMNDFGCTFGDGYEISPALVAQRMFDERGTKHGGRCIQKERLEILIMAMKDFHAGRKREVKYKIKEPFEFMELLNKVRKEDGLEG